MGHGGQALTPTAAAKAKAKTATNEFMVTVNRKNPDLDRSWP
jgi:hypothetical protein